MSGENTATRERTRMDEDTPTRAEQAEDALERRREHRDRFGHPIDLDDELAAIELQVERTERGDRQGYISVSADVLRAMLAELNGRRDDAAGVPRGDGHMSDREGDRLDVIRREVPGHEHEVCNGCGAFVDAYPEDCGCEFTGRTTVGYVRADLYRGAVEALDAIIAMAERADSPAHSMQGRANAWAGLGAEAVRLARAARGR